jgi:F-type H+-transporting ATPase subunit alpha
MILVQNKRNNRNFFQNFNARKFNLIFFSTKSSQIVHFLRKKMPALVKAEFAETGTVLKVGDGVVVAKGLTNAFSGELVEFETKELGIILNLELRYVKIMVFGSANNVMPGQKVVRKKLLAGINVSYNYLGRVIDSLGSYVDGGQAPDSTLSTFS